ncbi:MAG: fumarylacetoacetate hydrolase family protein [Steroidobacteraceae bacterium]|jgi:2-keto-4-pentenoate hydratase/2-oxohepta-3-ene-1,7-dioic acid hydratase in catechol pathway|nr:fumarylacetoacetate hydrolase family protein [Steroidobacteraceae bacterium]
MRLVRFGAPGRERPGALDAGGTVRDLSGVIADVSGATLGPDTLATLRAVDLSTLPTAPHGVRLGACVTGVGKIVAVGLNYREHATEASLAAPTEPVLFMKATSAITGPSDGIVIPKNARAVDWEVELGVVIGRRTTYVTREDALAQVAGYCVINDVSEREFQLKREGQWSKGKSADSFAPLGPWLVTVDDVPDPQSLKLWLDVNGHRMQSAITSQMIFGVAELIAYVSQFMTLHPGDVIATGTPSGVGGAMKPPRFLAPGDVVELGVEALGTQRHVVRAFAD